ncbi:glutathione binding-like protein [Vibrio sp. PP-XX7]
MRNSAPTNGTWERVRLQELLNFITSELHSGVAPLFNQELPTSVQNIFREKLFKRLDYLSDVIGHQDYLTGRFTIADAYLFTIFLWFPIFHIEISKWPVLAEFMARMQERPAVRAAIQAEDATMPV